jgi:hypothetical protein
VAATVQAGATEIRTVDPTDFAAGEVVVLTAPHEELVVAERLSATRFTVTTPVRQTHTSEVQGTFPTG